MAQRFRSPLRVVLAACLLAGAAACRQAAGSADPPGAPRARLLQVVRGLGFPESVRYDPEQDVFFVSNMNGPGSLKDGSGYLVRVAAGDVRRMEVFVRGGRNGATLHAPKGMAIQGDTLWVADIDVLGGFHRRTGAPVAEVDLRPHRAVLLNDVAVGPDGSLRVTDTGIAMTAKGVIYRGGDRVFAVGPGRAVSVHAAGEGLGRPNGITWDPEGRRWIVVTFHPFRSEVYALAAGGATKTVLAAGPGIAGRMYIAGLLTNTPEHMVRWIMDPPAVDPETAMPDMDVTEDDARDIAAYLYTLR